MRKLRLSFSPSGPTESLFSFKILLLCKPRLLYSLLKQKNMSLSKGNEIASLHGVYNGYNDTNDTKINEYFQFLVFHLRNISSLLLLNTSRQLILILIIPNCH